MQPNNDQFRGCLLWGAVGDALGAPIEFWSLSEIRSRFGPDGVTGYVGGTGAVTDDTQMALFTAEGLIRASVQQRLGGAADRNDGASTMHICAGSTPRATTGRASPRPSGESGPDGWLVAEKRLHHGAPRATPAYRH